MQAADNFLRRSGYRELCGGACVHNISKRAYEQRATQARSGAALSDAELATAPYGLQKLTDAGKH